MIRIKQASTAAACSLALALSACGGETSEETAAADTAAISDPCSLLGKEEVGQIVGDIIVTASAKENGCRYETEDAAAAAVEIEIHSGADASSRMQTAREASDILSDMGGSMEGGEGAAGDTGAALAADGSVQGIGGQAFFGQNNQLHVLDGNVYFTVLPPTMRSRMGGGSPMISDDEKKAMATELGRRIAAKV